MDRTRSLVLHGILLFLIGLLMGMVVQSVANPRVGLSAHVGTLLNATFLLALGAAWSTMIIEPRVATACYWLILTGSYVSCVALFFAGIFGTSAATPLLGAGHVGKAWQEAAVTVGLTAGGVALFVGTALLLWALRASWRG